MPVYQMQQAEIWEEDEPQGGQLEAEVDACREVKSNYRNRVRHFLRTSGITHISEMEYGLRIEYEKYLMQTEKQSLHNLCLNAFDRIKLHSMKEEMLTLAGKRKYTLDFAERIIFLPYYPKIEIAEHFQSARRKRDLVWDFTIPCDEKLKRQIFLILNQLVMSGEETWEEKEKLAALKFLYEFCISIGISDIDEMTLDDEAAFRTYLPQGMNERKRKRACGIIGFSRKHLFQLSPEINWKANVWYLERFYFSRERINPSKPVDSFSFREITYEENRNLLKKYMRYALGITDLSISTIRIKFLDIRKFLQAFDQSQKPAFELTAGDVDAYLKELQKKDNMEKTFNGQLISIVQFYNFLLVKGYMEQIPFRHEYYLQKEIPMHHDRSVRDAVCGEILDKLENFPEHLRLMFLHLWCVGLRCSEVCTLHGDAYEWKNGDAWIKVYQIKMKNYKRIPIPEALYQLMQVYIQKHHIRQEDYLFQNTKGGAFRYATFRSQMLRCCEENQIADGDYLFKSHDYRHNLATLYYDRGISIQAVRDYLGHDYEEMTRQYVDFMPKKLQKANEEYFSNPEHSLAAELMKGEQDGD
ncbi:tyrosine-type recombinase/integrase [Robinsoniella peoriensis]